MGTLRIIAGKWRGRRLHFPDVDGLRPTTDRTRETVFNWLAPHIQDAHCLDGFAGSGALGFEALSRGCAHVTFVEQELRLTQLLQQHAQTLNCVDQVSIVTTAFADYLCQCSRQNQRFDIIFLDPPFQQNIIPQCLQLLQQHQCLQSGGYIYLECEKRLDFINSLPTQWRVHRHKIASQVAYCLLGVA